MFLLVPERKPELNQVEAEARAFAASKLRDRKTVSASLTCEQEAEFQRQVNSVPAETIGKADLLSKR